MKRGFKKSLALLLAVFMTFGAVPFLSVGMIASAAELKNISISVGSKVMIVGEKQKAGVSAIYDDYTQGDISVNDVSFSSSNTKCITIEDDGTMTAIAPTVAKDKDGKVVTDKDGNAVHNPVTIKALYEKGETTLVASCEVTVEPKPVPVEQIIWNFKYDALLAGTGTEYSYAYNEEKPADTIYTLIPDNADNKNAKLECTPSGIIQINEEAKTFKVNPITQDSVDVIFTLTAEGAGEKCQPASKKITIYKDVPIKGVKWTFTKGSTNKMELSYFEKDANKKPTSTLAVYYYKPTELGNPEAEFKYEAIPLTGKPKDGNYLDLCDVTVESSDERVVTFHEETGRIIPVGNGEATLTITAKTPKGKVFKDNALIAVVTNSPYTPITSLNIDCDVKNTDSDAEYNKETNTLTLMFTHQIQLVPVLNSGASVDVKPIEVELDNGDTLQTVKKVECSWKSDDESIATVDKNGLVVIKGDGTTKITLTILDNGEKFVKEIKVRGNMPWWEVLVAILMCLFTGRWSKIPTYFKALFN